MSKRVVALRPRTGEKDLSAENILNALGAVVFVIDGSGSIVTVNIAGEQFLQGSVSSRIEIPRPSSDLPLLATADETSRHQFVELFGHRRSGHPESLNQLLNTPWRISYQQLH